MIWTCIEGKSFENTINPLTARLITAKSNAPGRLIFDSRFTYNISDREQATEDLQALVDGIRLAYPGLSRRSWDARLRSGHSFSQWDVQAFSGLLDTDIQFLLPLAALLKVKVRSFM